MANKDGTSQNAWINSVDIPPNAAKTKYASQPPQRPYNSQIVNMNATLMGTAPDRTSAASVSIANRSFTVKLDQRGKPSDDQPNTSAKNSQHNLYDLSDNKQRIKTQANAGRRRINYSQENLPSVEAQSVHGGTVGAKKQTLIKSYIQNYSTEDSSKTMQLT